METRRSKHVQMNTKYSLYTAYYVSIYIHFQILHRIYFEKQRLKDFCCRLLEKSIYICMYLFTYFVYYLCYTLNVYICLHTKNNFNDFDYFKYFVCHGKSKKRKKALKRVM